MTISVVALSGGVGGAKLASGLSRVVAPGNLLVAANTGDDFTHMGLHISPDIDSIFYAVTDLNNTRNMIPIPSITTPIDLICDENKLWSMLL